MTHLPFTLLAYFFNSLSVLASKFLLNKAIPDPLVYIFYISLFSILALFLLPFTKQPSLLVFNLASLSTIFWTLGIFLMFKALKSGPVSRVIPIIGTLIPLFLIIFSFNILTQSQLWTIFLLIVGMIVLTASDWGGRLGWTEIILEICSACLFAFSYLLLRQAYLGLDFFSVIVWSRLILIPICAILWLFLKQKLSFSTNTNLSLSSKSGLIFLGGQFSGVLSEFLLLYSISLATPALVNSLQGTQYIFLFILSREKYPKLVLISKLAGIFLIGVGLYLLAF